MKASEKLRAEACPSSLTTDILLSAIKIIKEQNAFLREDLRKLTQGDKQMSINNENNLDRTIVGFPHRDAKPPSFNSFNSFDYDDMPDETISDIKPVQDATVQLKKGQNCYYFEVRNQRGRCLIRLGLTAAQAAEMFTGGEVQAIAQFFGPEGQKP